ncbi:phage holin family protein [Pseudaestuariivita sp.]|uniref:phage holin family protein n=1 Tax=Pseudaestuariivita sp. TaxID=2211669 RepID=UPI004059C4B2
MRTAERLSDAPAALTQLFAHASGLVRAELRLFKAEMSENLSKAGFGLAMVAVSALVLLTALHVLAFAAVSALAAAGLSWTFAALVVTAAALIVAALCFLLGRSRLSGDALKPDATITQVQKDVATLKEMTHAQP